MKTVFRGSFNRDLKKINEQSIRHKIVNVIKEVEAAAGIREISNLKKLSGSGNYYRIRIGNYRIGVAVEDDIVEFVRCMHRRDLYRYFP